MRNTKQTGDAGEDRAEAWLQAQGYRTLVRNYRHRRGEIDLIMCKDDMLCFVEVKFRKNSRYGHPEEAVSDHKIAMIQETAENYLYEHPWPGPIRFDIIAITGKDMMHFTDAF